jgi:hypothetical protein
MPRREWEAPHFHLERATVETIRAAQKLLGAPTIDEGSAQAGGGGGRSQIRLHGAQNVC